MLILGIDPGIARLGWGIINADKGKITPVEYGCFETKSDQPEPERLECIYRFLTSITKKHQIEVLSVEDLFFAANAKTAFTVGQARGVVLVAAALNKLEIHSYTPLQVKQALTGYGRADKHQIQQMVKTLLKLTQIPRPDDAADALAIAITHAFMYKLRDKTEK